MYRIGYILIVLAVIGCSSKAGEITVYPLLCNGSLHNDDCRGQWLLLKRTVYRISAAKQKVSYWTPGATTTPKQLAKCTVKDTEDWRCSDPDGTAEKDMESGVFSIHFHKYAGSDVDKDYEARTRYVSWLRYWMARFSAWVKPPREY